MEKILWCLSPHAKSWLIGKDSDAGRDWGQEEKRTTEDEMAGWHHRLDEHKFEWTPGVGDGQGGLACCNSWGLKDLEPTERLNWTVFLQIFKLFMLEIIYSQKGIYMASWKRMQRYVKYTIKCIDLWKIIN